MGRAAVGKLVLGLVGLLVGAACAGPAAIPPALPAALQAREELPGRLAYVREGDVWIWERGEPRRLTDGGSWRQPALSPDGREAAFVLRQQNFSDLFAMAVEGGPNRRLSTSEAAQLGENDWTFRPAWSPDGSQIAYVSDAASYFPVVWLMNRDGSNKRPVLGAAANLDSADVLSWAPDGKQLAFTGMTKEGTQIYVLDLGRGIVEKLTGHPQGAFDPAWSPDGNTIAYVARDGGRTELRLKRPDGSGEARFDKLAYLRSPAWSPDGRYLAVLSAQSGAFEIWVASVQAEGELGDFRQLTHDGAVDAASGLSWAR